MGVMCILLLGVYYFFDIGYRGLSAEPSPSPDPNAGLAEHVEQFFTKNDAAEMVPIIKCESEFRHFASDGSVLTNEEGSSAIGIAQILTSVHPDPKVLEVYNARHDTELSADDFDLTHIEDNLEYALVLYEVRGTRDWECARTFKFAT